METAGTYISIVSTKKTSILHFLNLIFTYFLSFVLLFAGINKIINSLPLINSLSTVFDFLPEGVIVAIASLLPIVEIGLGLLLIFSIYNEKIRLKRKLILLTTTVLFTLFLAFSVYGYIIGLKNDCGCFGNMIPAKISLSMVVRNFVLTLIAFLLFIFNKRQKSLMVTS